MENGRTRDVSKWSHGESLQNDQAMSRYVNQIYVARYESCYLYQYEFLNIRGLFLIFVKPKVVMTTATIMVMTTMMMTIMIVIITRMVMMMIVMMVMLAIMVVLVVVLVVVVVVMVVVMV